MADYFTHFSCVLDVGSADNVVAALGIFERFADELDADENIEPGFFLEADTDAGPGALRIHADGYGEPEHVITFVLCCAEAFDLSGRWGFTWALTCSSPRPDGFGGGAQLLDLGAHCKVDWVDGAHGLASAPDARSDEPPEQAASSASSGGSLPTNGAEG